MYRSSSAQFAQASSAGQDAHSGWIRATARHTGAPTPPCQGVFASRAFHSAAIPLHAAFLAIWALASWARATREKLRA